MSAKELGQVHTVNFQHNITSPPSGGAAGESNMLLDLSGELTSQLQHMVRCGGNIFKAVGIDMALDPQVTTGEEKYGCTVNGRLFYYAPTAGRCSAMREAWSATKRAFKLQGINYRSNKNYDWRPLIASGLSNAGDFKNAASLEVVSGTPQLLYIKDQSTSTTGIFENWNNSVSNQQSGAAEFSVGWNIMQNAVEQDYVLNEGAYLDAGGRKIAKEAYEIIPFQLSYNSDTGITSSTFQWRPDPMLYQAILAGQIILQVDNATFDEVSTDESPVVTLRTAVYVSGWKSLMGNRRGSRASSKKTKSTKNHSKK